MQLLGFVVVLVMAFSTCISRAEEGATTQSSPTTLPTTQPSVTPAARAVLDQLRDAYAGLKSLEVAGTVTFDFDVAGQKENHAGSFTGSFVAPAKFRHEMKDDLLLVSDTEKASAYKPDVKQYTNVDAPKDRLNHDELPPVLGVSLQQQDPSLLLALLKDPSSLFMDEDVKSIDAGQPTTIDGKACPTLALAIEGQQVQLALDPATHLIRRMTVDVKDSLLKQNVPQVNKAVITIDYTRSEPGAAIADASFAWKPPADATLRKAVSDDEGAVAGGSDNAANQLVGKPAPTFALKDLQGNDISLAAQKGSVVVLDFWATWCGPCREGLPHLNQLNTDLAAKGLKVFAVNQRETSAVISKFIEEQHLGLQVLLDDKGKVGEQYHVTGIPQTVIIGKDGVVRQVFIGFGPGMEIPVRESVEAALKK